MNRNLLFLFAVLVAGLMVAGTVYASPIQNGAAFFATVEVDDGTFQGSAEVPLELNEDGTGFNLAGDGGIFEFENGDKVSFDDVSGEFDPVLNLSAAATDFGAPSTFGFTLVSPLIPALSGPQAYRVDLGGVFTDGGFDGGSLTANSFLGTGNTIDATVNGVPIDSVGGDAVFAGPLDFYGPFVAQGVYDCGVGGCTSFDIQFGFDGSGDGDTYALNGRFEIVPEPATMLLFGAGLLGLAALRRKIRN
jgi:hypothetical protein